MPRSGLAAAITGTPAAWSRSMTPAQLELSAKAPCTSTTVSGEAVVSWDMVLPPWSSEREHEFPDAGVEAPDLGRESLLGTTGHRSVAWLTAARASTMTSVTASGREI